MKEVSLEPISKQIQKTLEEMQVYLQEFEDLKDCYIEGNCIKCSYEHHHYEKGDVRKPKDSMVVSIIAVYFSEKAELTFDNMLGWFIGEDKIAKLDVFEERGSVLQSIKIKEPQPHQARKKTLEELGEGNGFYLFDNNYRMNEEAIKDVNCYKYFTITCDNYDEFQNLLKHTRILVALDEEEIENKVLD